MDFETLDPAILAALPSGGDVVSVVRHGKTNWSTGLRVDIEVDGEESAYFVKILDRDRAAEFAEGEYESQKALSTYIPDNVVHPIAWGVFEEDNMKAFFLTKYRDLQIKTPPLGEFLTILKNLHEPSTSPNGKFGFHVTTFYGASPMINDWCDSWEEFFTREFRSNLAYAQDNRGPDDELAEVAETFITTVIPRLLGPLQSGGRTIKPTLCHGDLWDGNIQLDRDTKAPIIFDACCFYGHNEMELQCMRDPRYAIGLDFLALYEKEVGASEPKEDFDDRNALYSMRNDLLTAGMWPQWAFLLQRVRDEMLRLLAKHPSAEYVEDPSMINQPLQSSNNGVEVKLDESTNQEKDAEIINEVIQQQKSTNENAFKTNQEAVNDNPPQTENETGQKLKNGKNGDTDELKSAEGAESETVTKPAVEEVET